MPTGFSIAIIDPRIGQYIEYRQLICSDKKKLVWTRCNYNELCHLVKGIRVCDKGANCVHFVHRIQIPKGNKITYGNLL